MKILKFFNFFKSGLESADWKKVIKAIEKISDQKLLADYAKVGKYLNHNNLKIRDRYAYQYIARAAVQRLTDFDLLADVAEHGEDYYARNDAQNKLIQIAKTSMDRVDFLKSKWATSMWNVLELTESELADVAKNAEIDNVRMTAANKITNKSLAQEVYSVIAHNAGNIMNRYQAADHINDAKLAESLYADILKSITPRHFWWGEFGLRPMVIKMFDKISNQDVLTDIAENAENFHVIIEAAMKLIDKSKAIRVIQKTHRAVGPGETLIDHQHIQSYCVEKLKADLNQ
jgi:hypothetical protein